MHGREIGWIEGKGLPGHDQPSCEHTPKGFLVTTCKVAFVLEMPGDDLTLLVPGPGFTTRFSGVTTNQ